MHLESNLDLRQRIILLLNFALLSREVKHDVDLTDQVEIWVLLVLLESEVDNVTHSEVFALLVIRDGGGFTAFLLFAVGSALVKEDAGSGKDELLLVIEFFLAQNFSELNALYLDSWRDIVDDIVKVQRQDLANIFLIDMDAPLSFLGELL